MWSTFCSFVALVLLSSCQPLSPNDSDPSNLQSSQRQRITTVDVATVTTENLANSQEYVGTTEPNSTTFLRSQVEGRLLDLNVNVGDLVNKNQVIGRLDDSLLAATVEQERAELASLESELTREQLSVKNTKISLQETKIELEQAKNDAQRYSSLSQIGAISQQQAESFETAAKVAQQAVFLAEEEVNIAQQAVTTAMGRVAAQQSAISEASQRQAYSQLIAPTTGIVVSKSQEPGNLVREGEEILSVGDLNTIKILLPISAVDLNLVALGQTVEVRLDAIQDKVFPGKVSKIAPVANANTRKINIEITVNNSNNEIKSGLLAKVQLPENNQEQIAVSQSAIVEEAGINYIFVVTEENSKQRQATVTKRQVTIDNSLQNEVFLTEGLKPGEKYIIRSSQPLTNNQVVNLSIISE
ncbi:efflux RND transporter periplasmic adaptor subunit [Hyella patelloides]|uniref:efflux RND transporter periplasmic adaptor subunit n=1 Tax=Hyella patelloides TaxID=1982969 RepID=UPI001C93C4F2|nr:efflux RND transporter periplasmic adaptor subunit [Hyella patelloides]